MPRGMGYGMAPEDPAYYEALAGGSSWDMAGDIAQGAVAGVAAPLLLRKQKQDAQAAGDQRAQMARSLNKALLAKGVDPDVAATITLEAMQKGVEDVQAKLANIDKTIQEAKLNDATIALKGTEGQENLATANKSNVDASLAPGIAESEAGYKTALGGAATTNANAASTNARVNLQNSFATKQGKDREQLFSEFKYFDKNGDGQIDREEAEKARMKERQAVRKEMEAINEEWDAYDAMPAEAKANSPAPTGKRIAVEDIAAEADRRAEEYLNDLNEVRLSNNDFLGKIGKTPLTTKSDSASGGGDDDTQSALAEISKFMGQKPNDPEGLIAFLKNKYPGMDEGTVRSQLGI